MKKILLLTIFSALLVQGYAQSEAMTLEQKAAKMLIVGMRGQELTPDNPVVEMIVEKGVSGVILFEHNLTPVEQQKDSRTILRKLLDDLQALTSEDIFLAVDQEGGRVNRLKSKYGFKEMVSQKAVGEKNDLAYSKEVANIISSEVRSAGFNINFAPCVDVDVNPNCPVIGKVDRSYSADVQEVVANARISVDSHREQGVITSLKHFPGHGSSVVDSHKGFTDITATWSSEELVPFQELIDEQRADIVMVGHLYNSDIDSNHPASLSKPAIDSLLRGEMGYKGVVMTDDMQMGAITNNYGFEEAVVLAVNAGVDMFIISSNTAQEGYNAVEAIDIIVRNVKNGRISETLIDSAIARIEALRDTL